MEEVFITNCKEETGKLGEAFIKRLRLNQGVTLVRGRIIALYGELGSGKTTFVQGLAKGVGIKKRIISPTFTIVRQYKVSPRRSPSVTSEVAGWTPRRCIALYHIDFYRIDCILV